MSELRAWKFICNRAEDPDHPGLWISGKVAVAVARSEEQARAVLLAWATAEGEDARWLRVATVTQVEISEPGFVTWASGMD